MDYTQLSNDEILLELKKNGLTYGPVTNSTRNVYIKKLENHFKKPNDDNNEPNMNNDDNNDDINLIKSPLIVKDKLTTPKSSPRMEFKLLKEEEIEDEVNVKLTKTPESLRMRSANIINKTTTPKISNESELKNDLQDTKSSSNGLSFKFFIIIILIIALLYLIFFKIYSYDHSNPLD